MMAAGAGAEEGRAGANANANGYAEVVARVGAVAVVAYDAGESHT